MPTVPTGFAPVYDFPKRGDWEFHAASATAKINVGDYLVYVGAYVSPGSAFTPANKASGAGIALPTGAAVPGALYFVKNINTTGVCNVYAVGGTINGTTGTTPYALETTGSKSTFIMCVTAGAWQVGPATT